MLFPSEFHIRGYSGILSGTLPEIRDSAFLKTDETVSAGRKAKGQQLFEGDEEAADDASGNQCRNKISSLRRNF